MIRIYLQIFTVIFTLEAMMKLLGLGLIDYFKDNWNRLDITIVVLSLVELGLRDVKGLSILRTFRLVSKIVCNSIHGLLKIIFHLIALIRWRNSSTGYFTSAPSYSRTLIHTSAQLVTRYSHTRLHILSFYYTNSRTSICSSTIRRLNTNKSFSINVNVSISTSINTNWTYRWHFYSYSY